LRSLFACAAGIENIAAAAACLNAAVASHPLSGGTDQRAHAVGPDAYRIERIEACDLHVEFGLRVAVEQIERLFRAVVPIAVGAARIAPDTLEMRLQ
jgi:hypothetical protein